MEVDNGNLIKYITKNFFNIVKLENCFYKEQVSEYLFLNLYKKLNNSRLLSSDIYLLLSISETSRAINYLEKMNDKLLFDNLENFIFLLSLTRNLNEINVDKYNHIGLYLTCDNYKLKSSKNQIDNLPITHKGYLTDYVERINYMLNTNSCSQLLLYLPDESNIYTIKNNIPFSENIPEFFDKNSKVSCFFKKYTDSLEINNYNLKDIYKFIDNLVFPLSLNNCNNLVIYDNLISQKLFRDIKNNVKINNPNITNKEIELILDSIFNSTLKYHI